jgi:glyoxylase-like metal-dependent hydrolase (beta-lactamase superfamily II)
MRVSAGVRAFVPALSILALLGCGADGVAQGAPASAVMRDTRKVESLQLVTHVAPANSFSVTSTLIYGPTEAVLIDTQFRVSEAAAVADEIAAKGRKLKAIFITHPDEDHYLGAAVLQQRFPATPIYMTAAALAHFHRVVESQLAGAKKYLSTDAPDAVPTPEPIPSMNLLVDGQVVEIIPDLQGDVLDPTNSFVWVPALRVIIAGDIAFNRVHVYLADSTEESRARWQESIRRIQSFKPRAVITGHKKSAGLADTPQVLIATSEYLTAFEASRMSAVDARSLVDSMKQQYPDYGSEELLAFSAQKAGIPQWPHAP